MSYQIADEPEETTLGHYVVDPNAPLLAMMTCGAWLAFPWFAFNAIAMGSPTRRKEIALCALAVAGTALLAWLVYALNEAGILPAGTALDFAILGIHTWKLALAYYISTVQARTFHVYQYYGGNVRSAAGVLGTGYWLRGLVLGLSDDPIWIIIVAGGV